MSQNNNNNPKILSKLDPKIQGMAQDKTGGWGPPRLEYPPVADKIIAWVTGKNSGDTMKLEQINRYDFTQVVPPLGSTVWSDIIRAPDTAEPGYTEILAVDDGMLYTAGVPNNVGRVALAGVNETNMFFCDRLTKGLGVYDLTLTPAEILECIAWWRCPVTHYGIDVTHDGDLVYHHWTYPLPPP